MNWPVCMLQVCNLLLIFFAQEEFASKFVWFTSFAYPTALSSKNLVYFETQKYLIAPDFSALLFAIDIKNFLY